MELYRNKYRSNSFRLENWDYGSPGYYYVTICTRDRKEYFGDVVMCDADIHTNRPDAAMKPWEDMCGGIAGTHNHASLPPAAHSSHVNPRSNDATSPVVRLTPIGKIAHQNWIDIPSHFPFVSLDEFVVMPDHLHGILCFHKPGYREHKVNKFGPQSMNLGSVIRNYKSATKSDATLNGINFAWQARYHDDVITSSTELEKIRKYIRENPSRWIEKKNNKIMPQ
jgi:REP element-mobilizing transposase RayT